MKRVYKVIRWMHNGYFSVIGKVRGMDREYKPNQWTYPSESKIRHGYGLCAFETPQQAEAFMNEHNECFLRVWECEAREVWIPDVPSLNLDAIRERKAPFSRQLRGFNLLRNAPVQNAWPEGTIMCSAIKLVRLLKGGKT